MERGRVVEWSRVMGKSQLAFIKCALWNITALTKNIEYGRRRSPPEQSLSPFRENNIHWIANLVQFFKYLSTLSLFKLMMILMLFTDWLWRSMVFLINKKCRWYSLECIVDKITLPGISDDDIINIQLR